MNISLNCGRAETPGHSNSPGVQHSSTAEIAAQQFKEHILHSGRPPSLNSTHLINWYIGIIVPNTYLVNRHFVFFQSGS